MNKWINIALIDATVAKSALFHATAPNSATPCNYKALGMPTKKPAGDDTAAGNVWGAHVDGHRSTVGFPVERRATLCLSALLGATIGVRREQLQQLCGVWGFVLAFRRECMSLLGISNVAARTLPSRRPCALSGALLDELLALVELAPTF